MHWRPDMRKNMLRSPFPVLLAVALGTASMSAAAAPSVEIDIARFAFVHREITIPVGTTVVWINHDETPHTVAAGDHSFTSPALDTDDRYERRFDQAGDVRYFCTVHPFMTGVVHVRKP